jgi:hypothetical protein
MRVYGVIPPQQAALLGHYFAGEASAFSAQPLRRWVRHALRMALLDYCSTRRDFFTSVA